MTTALADLYPLIGNLLTAAQNGAIQTDGDIRTWNNCNQLRKCDDYS
jgi:hypothetical protein